MSDDPKETFRRIRAKQQADKEEAQRQQAARKLQRQRERRERQPQDGGQESPAAQWVRDNMEWEEYPGLWVPKFCSWSDYSGSIVERSNGKALLRDYPDTFEEGTGGHGTVWVGIPEDKRLALTDEQLEAFKDVIEGLEDYPLIDDELHSQMEMESQWEFWKEYGRDGVREALTKKFEGDADAQIAVVAKRNEFWDTLFREHSFHDHMGQEEGDNWYFKESDAVSGIGRDEIVNDEEVAQTKRAVIAKAWGQPHSFVADLERELAQVGVDIDNAEHLWQILRYAERSLTPAGVWEIKERFSCREAECDPSDHIDISNYRDIVNVASEPEAHQKMLRLHWAEDPRQLKLPGMEGGALKLANAILDGENPKSVLRRASGPEVFGWVVNWTDRDGQQRRNLVYGVGLLSPLGARSEEDAADRIRKMWRGKVAAVGAVERLATWPQFREVQKQAVAGRARFQPHDGAELPSAAPQQEAEDPKSVLRAAANPNDPPRRWVVNGLPKKIEIWGKRWFSRTYGNTYFTAKIYVDDRLVHTMPEEYGYGSHYMHRAFEWLEQNGYVPPRPDRSAPWWIRDALGIQFEYHAEDVRRRRDLFV